MPPVERLFPPTPSSPQLARLALGERHHPNLPLRLGRAMVTTTRRAARIGDPSTG